MSYLSATENVGFSGITQNISEASCATQYKMAVDSVAGSCSDVNMFIHDSSGDEQTYIPHLSESFFHTKFKIDPNELYTFHDSDVIAGEITVSHTEDNFMLPENIDLKNRIYSKEDGLPSMSNGYIKIENKEIVTNGHFKPVTNYVLKSQTETKSTSKVSKGKTHVNNQLATEVRNASIPNLKPPVLSNNSQKPGISNVTSNEKPASGSKSNSETFLDVFKREQGVTESVTIKTEPAVQIPSSSTKSTVSTPKKPAVKSSQSRSRKGRGPTVHEALQRIPQPNRVLPLPNKAWHAPGEELFTCGPLDDKKPNAFRQLDSSSDDDNMPEFEISSAAVCVEESAAESRGARLALRRAAMRRQVTRAATALQLTKGHKEHRALASLIKKQLSGQKSSCRLPPQTVNHLLAMRGMTTVLTVEERKRLRESGWSGSESRGSDAVGACAEERCGAAAVPSARYCAAHVTLAPEQRLYAPCAAVFAGGGRCNHPVLPLSDQTPLCAEHAWKRDNYEMLSRENKPAKAARKRIWVPTRSSRPPRAPRRAKRRKPTVPKKPPNHEQSLSEINVCSNSSTYDSSEDTAMGGLSENEYITNNSHELEVGQVPPDDILDPSVLSQIPDEAFTEFFNQAESGAPFGESSELAAALEAVLDERALDITDVFPHTVQIKNKIVPAVTMEPSTAPS